MERGGGRRGKRGDGLAEKTVFSLFLDYNAEGPCKEGRNYPHNAQGGWRWGLIGEPAVEFRKRGVRWACTFNLF